MKKSSSFASLLALAAMLVLAAAQCQSDPVRPGSAAMPGSDTARATLPADTMPLPTPVADTPARGAGTARPTSATPRPAPNATPPNNTREVIQGRSPDQARIDSLKGAGGF